MTEPARDGQLPRGGNAGRTVTPLTDRIDAGRTGEPPPHRRLRLVLDLHADDVGELLRGLASVEQWIAEVDDEGLGAARACTSGGSQSGWHAELTQDDKVTHDGYVASLDEWKERNR